MHASLPRRMRRRAAVFVLLAALVSGPVLAQPLPNPAADAAEAAARPPLAIGSPVQLQLGRGQQAWFRLPGTAGGLIAQTRWLSRSADTVLTLVDAQGRTLAEDDDGGEESLASRIEISADQAGSLFLVARLFDNAPGRFELVLEAAPPPDPNGPPATLVEAVGRPPLEVGTPVTVRLRPRQAAWFRLPDGGQDLVVLTRGLTGGVDTVLSLVDADGQRTAEDDDGGEEDLASRLEVPAAQRRPLFVQVRTLSGHGSFELVVQPDTAPAAADFALSQRQAASTAPLAIGETRTIHLRRGQSAWFRLPEGDLIAVTRNLRRGTDTMLALYDANGRQIAEDDDGGGGLASRIEIGAGEARPAFLRAYAFGDAAGEFDLALEADAPAAVTWPTSLEAAMAAPPLQPGQAVQLRLRRGQSAFFALPRGQHVVMTRRLGEGSDTVLELLDRNGTVQQEDDDGGEEPLSSRLAVEGAAKEQMFVRAGILGDGGGSFELILVSRRR